MEISDNMFLGAIVLGFITLFISCGILLFMIINTVTASPQTFGQSQDQQLRIADGARRRMPRINNSENSHTNPYWKNTAL